MNRETESRAITLESILSDVKKFLKRDLTENETKGIEKLVEEYKPEEVASFLLDLMTSIGKQPLAEYLTKRNKTIFGALRERLYNASTTEVDGLGYLARSRERSYDPRSRRGVLYDSNDDHPIS